MERRHCRCPHRNVRNLRSRILRQHRPRTVVCRIPKQGVETVVNIHRQLRTTVFLSRRQKVAIKTEKCR